MDVLSGEDIGPVSSLDPGSVDRKPPDSYNLGSVWPTECKVFRGISSLIADVEISNSALSQSYAWNLVADRGCGDFQVCILNRTHGISSPFANTGVSNTALSIARLMMDRDPVREVE